MKFSETARWTSEWTLAVPQQRRLLICLPGVYSSPEVRPPVLHEMEPDINGIIAGLARQYTDESCMALHYDELMAEGRLKLAKLVHRGEIERQPTRSHFFRYFRATVANHFRSLVGRHRFTQKRTGVKPPPRRKAGETPSEAQLADEMRQSRKPAEVSLDDEDAHLQVAGALSDNGDCAQLIDDCLALLTPFEQLVFREMIQPSPRSRFYAELDAYIGKHPKDPLVVTFRTQHHAQGLGIDLNLFRQAVLSIRKKIKDHENMSPSEMNADVRRRALIQQLSAIFDVQVPAGEPEIVVRRLFTIAARDQSEKLTEQTSALLVELGAKPPLVYGDHLSCYGVLHQRNDPRCTRCGLRESCATEAANYGLAKIAISPRLLGAKNIRIPAVLPTTPDDRPSKAPLSEVEMDVLAHLELHFERVQRGDGVFFASQPSKTRKLLFCLEGSGPMQLRFCDPSTAIRKHLVGQRKSWYAPAGATADQLIALIDQHAFESTSED